MIKMNKMISANLLLFLNEFFKFIHLLGATKFDTICKEHF